MIPNTPYELARTLAHNLDQKYNNTALSMQYAWWMLETVTQQTKANLLARNTLSLSSAQHQQLDHWVERQMHEDMPLQYLIGTVPFGDCTIHVEPPILIPRPETEYWCFSLIDALQKMPHQSFTLLDIGTGSGCIAIALARAFPHATIYATDISPHALALAQKNALHNNVSNITFVLSDLFDHLPKNIKFDLIVSNPPYIAHNEWQTLDPSVRAWEDKNALIASQEGIGTLQKIINKAPAYIQPTTPLRTYNIPQLIVEIGYQQGSIVASLFRNAHFYKISVNKDLQGNDRTVVGYSSDETHSIT